MSIREKIVNWLLKEDEVIIKKGIVKNLLKEEQPELNETPKQVDNYTVYGDDPAQCVIRKRKTGLFAYWYTGDKPYQVKGSFEELKDKIIKFREAGCTPENWNKIMRRKNNTNPDRYISKNSSGRTYTIRKQLNRKQYSFGTYSSKKNARTIRDYLEYCDWNPEYSPSKLCGQDPAATDEFYIKMLPIIYGDNEYAQYQENNGGK